MPQERILVVDDEESVRGVVAALLERSGYSATLTESAEEAIARLQQDPDYDLVLSDIMMPGTDGLTLLDHICTDHPGMPVVMLSARGRPEDALRGLAAGATAYVTKPFSLDELEDLLTAVVSESPAARDLRRTRALATLATERQGR